MAPATTMRDIHMQVQGRPSERTRGSEAFLQSTDTLAQIRKQEVDLGADLA